MRSDERLEPYDETLNDQPVAAKRRWAQAALEGLDSNGFDYSATIFEIHAGNDYRSFGLVDGLERRSAVVEVPAAHLGQGEQLAFYNGLSMKPDLPHRTSSAATARPNASSRGSYQPLSAHLSDLGEARAVLTFSTIERILGRALPASARKHRAWWSNEQSGSHSHARAWMGIGWRVESVDFNAARVEFERGHT